MRNEVMDDCTWLQEIAESVVELAKGMTMEERQKYRDEGLYENLANLGNESDECDEMDMEGLVEVYAAFDGKEETGKDGRDDDNGEGDEAPGRDGSFKSASSNSIPAPTPPRAKYF